jgi:hypothetical protein
VLKNLFIIFRGAIIIVLATAAIYHWLSYLTELNTIRQVSATAFDRWKIKMRLRVEGLFPIPNCWPVTELRLKPQPVDFQNPCSLC